jgi:AcrR family transcriptional regulator
MSARRPLRVDAERNRQRLLEVAEAVFAQEGLDVPIDEIARRAGLGIGTLYRHFPTKEALFAAIVVGRLQQSVAEARALTKAEDPVGAFFGFVARLTDESARKKDFMHALASSGFDLRKAAGDAKIELQRALAKLLKRAQDSGAVRKDVEAVEVLVLVASTSSSIERLGAAPKRRQRLVAILCDGLRTRTAE